MKKFFRTHLVQIILLAVCAVAVLPLSSCDDDDYYWDIPSSGFIDRQLIGTWELVQIDGQNIYPENANYFSFGSRGYGRYYYHVNGRPYSEELNYWCEYDYHGGRNWLMIDYSDGSSADQQYWFSDGGYSLWMQFTDNLGRITTYRYQLIDDVPW